MKSSAKVKKYDKYSIEHIDNRYYVVNQEIDNVVTVSRSYGKAVKHILNSTGYWPRCAHEYELCYSRHPHMDYYKCSICGARRNNVRIVKRNIRKK